MHIAYLSGAVSDGSGIGGSRFAEYPPTFCFVSISNFFITLPNHAFLEIKFL